DDLSTHTTRYTSPTLTQKVFANMHRVGKGFSRVETPLFASMLVQPQAQAAEEEDDVEEQPTDTFESSMTLLNTLMETCATLSQKFAQLEQDKITQALEIIKLKKRVKKLEKKRRSKSLGLKRGEIAEIDADEDITLVDMETQVDFGAELQGMKDDDNAASKDVDATEPTVFDDKEVTMTMASTLIKMKAEKARLLDEQIAKRPINQRAEVWIHPPSDQDDKLKKLNGLLDPLYTIKECSSCGALYTMDYFCSKGCLVDKIICDLNKTPDLFQEPPQNCPKCGNPVDGQYCQGCALLRKELKEV
nr:hypothetical protein [Tanacetum cinerariifolium]